MTLVNLRNGRWAKSQVGNGAGAACATPVPVQRHSAAAAHSLNTPLSSTSVAPASFQAASSSPLVSSSWSPCRQGLHHASQRQVSARSGAGREPEASAPATTAAAPTEPPLLRSAASGDGTESDSPGPSNPGPPGPRPAPIVDAVFATRYGTRFRVRPYTNDQYGAIIDLQSEAFHTLNPVPFLNDFTYKRFRAEVVDALKQKTKYSDPSIFQLLVAEEAPDQAPEQQQQQQQEAAGSPGSGGSSSGGGGGGKVVGVVEVSLMEDRPVLRCLPAGTREYAYVSSMCVLPTARRRGVAQALMSAAEEQARLWGQQQLALHVYRDNAPAVQLYGGCGMAVVNTDPDWKAWFGDRVRLLMHKRLA
ncbi:hypothetical protein HXX76_005192 [Chlamydomonas incerta]|uniref:N-acetyltransferase domain-containing protein n=1 Tax=Chlamydomonas incerta TaxID=51695 RepID=A0A835TH63_CHLIN|nr:hypothetical protein HXX76_005192 [Chlamydomonas incerta]|eukprot:KAG2438645.1 hypothetical protein HXX76_005192 [Chlamydomonas incerta]